MFVDLYEGNNILNIVQGKEIQRSGVIPYTIHNNMIYFLLAQDRSSKDYTDFGGGCKQKECVVSSAIREFREESSNVLDDMYYSTERILEHCILALSFEKKMCVFFLPLPDRLFFQLPDKFPAGGNHEVYKLQCFDQFMFQNLILYKHMRDNQGYRIYARVQNFFRSLFCTYCYGRVKSYNKHNWNTLFQKLHERFVTKV